MTMGQTLRRLQFKVICEQPKEKGSRYLQVGELIHCPSVTMFIEAHRGCGCWGLLKEVVWGRVTVSGVTASVGEVTASGREVTFPISFRLVGPTYHWLAKSQQKRWEVSWKENRSLRMGRWPWPHQYHQSWEKGQFLGWLISHCFTKKSVKGQAL
jgi:hypothetical protein